MKILFCSAEVSPFAKVGGLADVAGSLPKAIKAHGHDIRVIMPAYGLIDYEKYNIVDVDIYPVLVQMGNRDIPIHLKQGKLPNSDVPIYFVVNEEYFGAHNAVYPQDKYFRFEMERYSVFSKAVLELIMRLDFKPDIIHCNDWHTASIPLFLKEHFKWCHFHEGIKTVFSIHNFAYQGRCGTDILHFTGLPDDFAWKSDKLEYYGGINWMKGALLYSDMITTVSEKYAEEILTPEYGEGLDGLLRWNTYKLKGILNGLDYDEWNPETDKSLVENFSAKSLAGKKECKKALQKEYKLEQNPKTPLIGLVSRLVDQKGIDLIAEKSLYMNEMDLQFVLLGSGDYKYEGLFKYLNDTTKNIRASIGYNSQLAERIYSGCDMFLMPSRFEPCGLGQLIALRYGTLPIVRETGGLADTVSDFDAKGNGFVFKNYSSDELLETINRACEAYKNQKKWVPAVKRAMKMDFSWDKSAIKYLEVYQGLL